MKNMLVLAIGLDHKTAPLHIRERLAVGRSEFKEALMALKDFVPEGVILSTCNRTEVYSLIGDGGAQVEELKGFLCRLGNMLPSELLPHLYILHQEEAVRHLFRISSGVESMVIGEFEVLGQVRSALQEVEACGGASLPLLSLFRQAVRVGRRARMKTGISRNPVSVSSLAIDLAAGIVADTSRSKLLFISAGEAGKLAVKAASKYSVSAIAITSRSYEKAVALASKYGCDPVPFEELDRHLAEADIVISSSGAPDCIVKPVLVADAMQARPDRPLVLIDIAVPRDIHPDVRKIGNVFLYDIDDLEAICESNHRFRHTQKERVEAIVEEEVRSFLSRWHALQAVPAVKELVNRAEEIRLSQIEKSIAMLDLSEKERAVIDALTRSIVSKLLHEPIAFIKDGDGSGDNIRIAREMFGLDKQGG